jgi:hypothetical protein
MGELMSTQSPRRGFAELAAGRIDAEDVRVLAAMADGYTAIDPVPAGLVERIKFGITLDALHAEVAELQRCGDLTGARSGGASDAQTVTFTSASLTTMVTITPISADRARLDGWVAPGGEASIEVRTADGSRRTTADADGRFVFEDVPRGLVQFVLRPTSGTAQNAVITPSIEI